MEQSMNMLNPNPELPDVSEFMTKLFSKGSSKPSSRQQRQQKCCSEEEVVPVYLVGFH